MKMFKLLNLLLIGFVITTSTAQDIPGFVPEDSIPALTEKDSLVVSSWNVGLGINVLEDTGDGLSDFGESSNQYHMVPYPSRINIERNFRNGLGIGLIGSVNEYQKGKFVETIGVNPEDRSFLAVDARLIYDLNKIFGETGIFDPYVGAGAGFTRVEDENWGTYNAIVGFRLWISEKWGIDLNSSGKWSFGDESNYIQHGAAVVHRFGIEKGLTKRGEEKAAMIRAIQAKNQRLLDSLAAARDAEEQARLLAERQERERREAEARQLAAQEQARKDALRAELDEIGAIYFAFNSSYLNEESKNTLDQLAGLLKANPELTLQIESHTDSRGTDKYNNWLSGRRAERTTEYLLEEHGLPAERINAQGLGETQLTNNCTDGVRCTEEEHRQNRRSEFRIVEF